MMLSSARMAAFKPFTVSNRQIHHIAGPCLATRHHAISRGVRVQAQKDEKPTQTQETPSAEQQQQPQQPEELPIWVRREKEREMNAGSKELPWPLYLLLSAFVAIASVGSFFEYFDKNALFGVIPPESPLWAPILGLFALTGLPTAGFLFFKGVNAANEAAEKQDKMDGYIK